MIYYGKYKQNYGFLDSNLIDIPNDAISITTDYWKKLLIAESKGGKIKIENNKVVAVDNNNNIIDLNNMENKVYYKPFSIKDIANFEMEWINEQINYTICMDEVFTDEMKKYVKTVKEILNGKNIKIPDRPTNISMEKK